jgi:mRNA degradation ribonuclease J1/J2
MDAELMLKNLDKIGKQLSANKIKISAFKNDVVKKNLEADLIKEIFRIRRELSEEGIQNCDVVIDKLASVIIS